MALDWDRRLAAAKARTRRVEFRTWLGLGILGLLLVVGYYAYAVHVMLRPAEVEAPASAASAANVVRIDQLGQLGDSVGGFLNPILTVLLVIAAAVTYMTQSADFKANQRLLIEQMAEAQQQDRRRLFLDLVSILERLLDDIRVDDARGRTLTGRDAVAEVFALDVLTAIPDAETRRAHIRARFLASRTRLLRYLRAAEVVLDFGTQHIHDPQAPRARRASAHQRAEEQALHRMLLATFAQPDLLVFAGALLGRQAQDDRLCELVRKNRLLEGLEDPALRNDLVALSNPVSL